MKNLFSLLVLALVLTMTAESFAQRFGVKGGLNLSNMLIKDDDKTYSDDFKMKPGIHIGVTAEFPMTEMLSFETGLLLSTKGFKLSREGYEGKMSLNYLDIPLTGKASFDIESVKVYGVFGPYVGIGISGKSKFENTYEGETEIDDDIVVWGSDKEESDFKRLDFGLTVGAGVELNAIQIGTSYNMGLANISPDTEDGRTNKNRVLQLSIAYKFGGE